MNYQRFGPLLLSIVFVVGCGGSFSVNPVTPAGATAVSEVAVTLDDEIKGDKRTVLNKLDATTHIKNALEQSFAGGEGPSLQVAITQFRTGGFGPSRMHMVGKLVDSTGAIVKEVESDSTSMRGGNKATRVRRVAQQCVDRLVAEIEGRD